MNENMNIKIGDFGISKQLSSYKTHTLTKKKLGSEYYAALKYQIMEFTMKNLIYEHQVV